MDALCWNDEPTLNDELGRAKDVKELGDRIIGCDPPMVFGVHGDWGAGKTSFLQQVHLYLKKGCPEAQLRNEKLPSKVDGWDDWHDQQQITVIWFEAWRYQHEANPIIALLHEIRSQLPWLTKASDQMGKAGETAVEAIVSGAEGLIGSAGDGLQSASSGLAATGMDLSVVGALAAIGSVMKSVAPFPSKFREAREKWDREHYATQLPTHVIREVLHKAIEQLIGGEGRCLVILVDDLDRCESEAAYRLLEGIKIYLNIPSCVFVIGMDQKLVELAVRKHTEAKNEHEKDVLAREYVEKICRIIWQIPAIVEPGKFLHQFLKDLPGAQDICDVIDGFECLSANPRKIKAFAHTVSRFMKHVRYRHRDYREGSMRSIPNQLRGKHKKCRGDAGLVVTMACLYHFHYEMYRILESDLRFYESILAWARGDESLALESTGVYFTAPPPAESLPLLPGQWVKSVQAGVPVMVGEFIGGNGQPNVMLVNLSLERSAKLTLEFAPAATNLTPQRVSPEDATTSPLDEQNTLWLTAGQGALIRLTQ